MSQPSQANVVRSSSLLGDTKRAPKDSSVSALRVAPHSIDCEQALLACCIMEGAQESLTACIEAKIVPQSFFKPAHQTIFQALLDLYSEGTPVDEIMLGEKLHSKGQLQPIGGIGYINEITNRIDTPAHIKYYLEKVRDLALVRRLIKTATKTIETAYENHDDLQAFIESVEQEIFKISEDRIVDTIKPLTQSVDEAVALVNRMIQNKGELTGITTGFKDLDILTSGLHPTDMVVIAGRPSMGKTALSLNIAEASILHPDPKKRVPTLIFSLEMSAEQLAMRLLCSYARVDVQQLKDGFITKEAESELAHAARTLKTAPLWIDDSVFTSILEMRAKARRLHAQKKGLGLIIIDYLQLVAGTDNRTSREQQIAEISRGVKAMAKELNVPVLIGSQLNRDSEKERRQPRLSDLRESGSIEQDADLVLLLSRIRDADEEQERHANVVLRDLIIAKQRNGPVGKVSLTFNKKQTRFENSTQESEF